MGGTRHDFTEKCSREDCDKSFSNHRWGKYEAQKAGWFFQKNGDAWCPDHHPDWVKEWREKKNQKTS